MGLCSRAGVIVCKTGCVTLHMFSVRVWLRDTASPRAQDRMFGDSLVRRRIEQAYRCSCSQLSKSERVSVLFCRHCIHSFVSVSLEDCHCTSVPVLGPCGLQAMRSCFGGKGPDDGSVGIAVCNLRNCWTVV